MFTLLWVLGLVVDHSTYSQGIYVPGYFTDTFGEFVGIPNCDIAARHTSASSYTCIVCSNGYHRVLQTTDDGRLYHDCQVDEPIPTPEVLECPSCPPVPTCEECPNCPPIPTCEECPSCPSCQEWLSIPPPMDCPTFPELEWATLQPVDCPNCANNLWSLPLLLIPSAILVILVIAIVVRYFRIKHQLSSSLTDDQSMEMNDQEPATILPTSIPHTYGDYGRNNPFEEMN